jgi:arginyl-tRNA synthetase
VTQRILSELAQVVTAHYGAFYILKQDDENQNVKLKLFAAYAITMRKIFRKSLLLGRIGWSVRI